jgi:hypothetical protein
MSEYVLGLKNIGGAFADNDAGRHGVPGRDAGRDRPVGDAKVFSSKTFSVASTTEMASWPIFAVQVWCQ